MPLFNVNYENIASKMKYMMRSTFWCFTLLVSMSFQRCGNNLNHTEDGSDIRIDVRLGVKFYSLFIDEGGKGYVLRGEGSFFSEPLKIESFSRSEIFRVDSIVELNKVLSQMIEKPIIRDQPMGTMPRIEIYYGPHKVYDAYRWDATVWDGVKQTVEVLSVGFNPFRIDDKPFERD